MSSTCFLSLPLLDVRLSGPLFARSSVTLTRSVILTSSTTRLLCQVKSGLTSPLLLLSTITSDKRSDPPSGFYLPLPNHFSARCGGDHGVDELLSS
ncbi:hypothetical protein G6F35_018933 [Rhizopus arrhizus]|nr:hypothetical protein G6F21_013766 [Rhizopus arrhizus]KAG1165172.1 hypothetical protein G6F35_018933 [Rhizopus arrhizus]